MPKKKSDINVNEWSNFIKADHVDKNPVRIKIEANKEQLKDVALRSFVPKISFLKAGLTLEREQSGRVVHVAGCFQANVTLLCSISAEEFELEIEEPVEGWFEDKESTVSFIQAVKERNSKQSQQKKGNVEVEISSEEADPEAMVNGQIDLGELVVQHLILSIPAYPRKEGAESEYINREPEVEMPKKDSPLRKNPFEALKDWKESR